MFKHEPKPPLLVLKMKQKTLVSVLNLSISRWRLSTSVAPSSLKYVWPLRFRNASQHSKEMRKCHAQIRSYVSCLPSNTSSYELIDWWRILAPCSNNKKNKLNWKHLTILDICVKIRTRCPPCFKTRRSLERVCSLPASNWTNFLSGKQSVSLDFAFWNGAK